MGTSCNRVGIAGCLLLAAIAIPAASQEDAKALTGTYAIAGKEAIDPPPGQPTDTHLQLFLTGDSARDLYRAMKVKEVPDECIGHEARSKFQGGIACTKHAGGKEYECSLALDPSRARRSTRSTRASSGTMSGFPLEGGCDCRRRRNRLPAADPPSGQGLIGGSRGRC